MLTLTFLGTGSAFARRNYQSNALLEAWTKGPMEQEEPDDSLLIDFGGTGPTALHSLVQRVEFGWLRRDGRADYAKIRKVFLTHLHADHVGGFEELAVMGRVARGGGVGDGAELFLGDDLVEPLWTNVLSGGLSAMNGARHTLDDWFAVRPLGTSGEGFESFEVGGYELSPVRTNHIQVAAKYDWPSYGLLMRDRSSGASAVYSGDTQFDPEGFLKHFEAASLVFHDAMLTPMENGVHASVDELMTLSAEVRRKMALYHYGDEWEEERFGFVGEEFAGFAGPRERYTVFG